MPFLSEILKRKHFIKTDKHKRSLHELEFSKQKFESAINTNGISFNALRITFVTQ
jgi:hypothetical protein